MRRRRLWGWFATALAAAAGAWGLMLWIELRETAVALQESTVYVAQMSGELATTRRDADRLVEVLGILHADDLIRIDLTGRGAAPGATGRLFASHRGLLFHAERLPSPGPGRVYQLWLGAGDARPVNAGGLEVNAFGMATLSGVLPEGARGVITARVTDEPEAGSSVPATAPILADEHP